MPSKPKFTKVGFMKACLLPALVIFFIPGFGFWFFDHVESYFDGKIRESLLSQIQQDKTLTPVERNKATQFYSSVSVSKILASNKPSAKRLQAGFYTVQTRYAIFRWMKRISLVCLLSGLGALVGVGIGVLLSFRSQLAQYWSLRVGWTVLRWFALVEVIGQGILAVALSFWVT